MALALAAALVAGCGGGGGGADSPAPEPVLPPKPSAALVADWNRVVVEASQRHEAAARLKTDDDVVPLTDSEESRVWAMAFVAMHDALNAVDRRYAPAIADLSDREADAGAALVAAGHAVLVASLPEQKDWLDGQRDAALAARPAGAARSAGVTLGQAVAAAVLAARANDGANGPAQPVYSSKAPGEYRFTRCPQDEAMTNFSACGPIRSDWPKVKPWALEKAAQFRAPNPYGVTGADKLAVLAAAVATPAYAADFDEVKFKGVSGGSSTRTAEESVIAMFWEESSHRSWNRAAEAAASDRKLDAWARARLSALLHLAIADTWISVYEAKYHYAMWRPVTGIHYALEDGNPLTMPADCPVDNPYCWNRFGRSTPPTQEYPSAHAALGGAAEKVIAAVIGTDRIAFSLTAQQPPDPTLVLDEKQRVRTYASLSQAAQENADSRIYIGFHFRESTRAGLAQGRQIGSYVVQRMLNER